jgi:pimeloyl-ACP methyl ester carboxylesterase
MLKMTCRSTVSIRESKFSFAKKWHKATLGSPMTTSSFFCMAQPAPRPAILISSTRTIHIEAMVNHIKRTRNVQKVTLIGWSWGAMMGGYYASLHSENVQKLVLYAPLYDFNDHTNLGPGSGLQNKRKPTEFNFALGAYRVASEAANTARWNGEIPVENKDEYRDSALPAAFWNECLATDPTSNSRTPASLRAPNGVLEDSFYQATGRPLWNAANIYAPTLVIGGDFDTWSFQEDREGLTRALVHAPTKRNVVIKDATHFVLFEKESYPVLRRNPEVYERISSARLSAVTPAARQQ